jgi:ABC-type glycerol-3-phosphate transport system permease component
MTHATESPSLTSLRWFRTLLWTGVLFLLILFVLPLLYEIWASLTPAVDANSQRRYESAVSMVSNVFSWVVLLLGCMLAMRQYQTHNRREYLYKRIRDRRKVRKTEAAQAQRERLAANQRHKKKSRR